jgi:hypothetical protein
MALMTPGADVLIGTEGTAVPMVSGKVTSEGAEQSDVAEEAEQEQPVNRA